MELLSRITISRIAYCIVDLVIVKPDGTHEVTPHGDVVQNIQDVPHVASVLGWVLPPEAHDTSDAFLRHAQEAWEWLEAYVDESGGAPTCPAEDYWGDEWVDRQRDGLQT